MLAAVMTILPIGKFSFAALPPEKPTDGNQRKIVYCGDDPFTFNIPGFSFFSFERLNWQARSLVEERQEFNNGILIVDIEGSDDLSNYLCDIYSVMFNSNVNLFVIIENPEDMNKKIDNSLPEFASRICVYRPTERSKCIHDVKRLITGNNVAINQQGLSEVQTNTEVQTKADVQTNTEVQTNADVQTNIDTRVSLGTQTNLADRILPIQEGPTIICKCSVL